jgi:hypothetical protein
MAWDTHARRKIDLVGRKDDGDKVIAHEFDFSIRNQVWSQRFAAEDLNPVMYCPHVAQQPRLALCGSQKPCV